MKGSGGGGVLGVAAPLRGRLPLLLSHFLWVQAIPWLLEPLSLEHAVSAPWNILPYHLFFSSKASILFLSYSLLKIQLPIGIK